MFKVSITEGWIEIMFNGIDAQDKAGLMPLKDHNRMFPAIFFCFFVFIGAWFMLNIFDNITIDNYLKEKDKSIGIEKLTHEQRLWIKLQHKASHQKPRRKVFKPEVEWKEKIFIFVTSNLFEGFIMTLIIINMIMLMLKQSREQSYDDIIEDINLYFLIIFCLEAFLKIICMGKNYFYDYYNRFDFFVVIVSILTLLLEKFLTSWIKINDINQ
jgi:hypothetical protein